MASLKKRGKTYYAQYYQGGEQKRVGLGTSSLQVAKEKIRRIESALAQGSDIPLPTKTPIAEVVTAYVEQLRIIRAERNVQRDVYYLREAFGPICPAISIKNSRISQKAKKRPCKNPPKPILANYFEQVTTADIAQHIAAQVRSKGLAPKTANRFREVLTRLYNWAMQQHGIKMPGNQNPAAKVERYKEKAPQISFLTLEQIEEQLSALKETPQIQTMIALYIYAGIRREEALWLRMGDVDLTAGTHGMLRIRAKTIEDEHWQPKTGVNRLVPISSTLRKYLDSYTPPKPNDGWMFPSPKGTRWDADNFSAALRKANRKADLTWSCLDYRHTFGSQLAMKGESLYKISKLMGNSPEICRRHYAALTPDSMLDCVEF